MVLDVLFTNFWTQKGILPLKDENTRYKQIIKRNLFNLMILILKVSKDQLNCWFHVVSIFKLVLKINKNLSIDLNANTDCSRIR